MKRILYLGLLIFIFCILLIFTYKSVQITDMNNCYSELAKDLEVTPTYRRIGDEYLSRMTRNLVVGMDQEAVIYEISKIAPVEIINGKPDDTRIEVSLDLCKVPENNFRYLIRYQNGKFVDIMLGSFSDW